MNLRSRLAKLSRVVAARAPAEKLVVVCAAVGSEMAAGRAPGVYPHKADPWDADVVFDGATPDEDLLATARARLGKSAIIIVLGPEYIPPPAVGVEDV